jgi:hypothetical protein
MSTQINKSRRNRPEWAGLALGLLLLMFLGFALAVEPAVAPLAPGAAAERLLSACLPHYLESACRCVARTTPIDERVSELERLTRDADDPEGAYAKRLAAAVIACASQAD